MSGISIDFSHMVKGYINSDSPDERAHAERVAGKARRLLIQEGGSPDKINALSTFDAITSLTADQAYRFHIEEFEEIALYAQNALRSKGGGNHLEKLGVKVLQESLQKIKYGFKQSIKIQVNNLFRLAEIKGVPPHQLKLSEQQIREALEKVDADRANQAFEKLMNESSKTKKPKRGKKPHQIAPPKSRGPASAPSPAKAAKAPPKQQMPWSTRVLHLLQTSPDLKSPEHPRVTERWKAGDLKEIQTFDNGKYAEMDETALKVQRARHFLPGLERIFNTKSTKDLYTFQTSNHSPGILCEMSYASGKKEEGVVYLGFGTENRKLLIHRYFEPFKSFKGANEVFAGRRVEQLELEKESEWIPTTPYQFEKMEADGTIQLKFAGEGHSLRIFPTKREKVASLLGN